MIINPSYLKVLQETLDELSPKYIRKVIIYAKIMLDIQREQEGNPNLNNTDNDND